jgi:starch synthase
MKKILFVTSEAYPLIKTGGLADVSGSLPAALAALGHDARIVMPAYADVLAGLSGVQGKRINQVGSAIEIYETRLPGTNVPVWLVAHNGLFDRFGNPYLAENGKPWDDNAERFALLCRVAVEIAMNRVGFNWKPEIIHCNDWQSGLIPALLQDEPDRPATIFTIHNLAYQGVFPPETFRQLGLPPRFWSPTALEFYGQLSFIKGGLVYADRVNTVSPNYAIEIQGKEFGCGLEGLLKERGEDLSGIINGIDADAWNPATDPHLAAHFDLNAMVGKAENKAALQQRFNLEQDPSVAVIAMVGRTVQQKGIDLLIEILPDLMELPLQLIILGSGEQKYEQTLKHWNRLYPDRIALTLGYDEALAHLIEAGSDMFLMPSRFEPCGLNQMYSQRYGTVPIVRRVGGLADTVEDTTLDTLIKACASGIVFDEAEAEELLAAVKRALDLFANKAIWEQIQKVGMGKDFSWRKSALKYLDLYHSAIQDKHGTSAKHPQQTTLA